MVKVRMNTADVAAEVKCLKKLIGMRCSNVYDITPKVFYFFSNLFPQFDINFDYSPNTNHGFLIADLYVQANE